MNQSCKIFNLSKKFNKIQKINFLENQKYAKIKKNVRKYKDAKMQICKYANMQNICNDCFNSRKVLETKPMF